MGQMVRKQVRLSQHLAALLETTARERGVSQSEVVRQALDHEAERAEAWEEASGSWSRSASGPGSSASHWSGVGKAPTRSV